MTFLGPIGKIFFSRVSRSVPFSKKKDPRRGGGPISHTRPHPITKRIYAVPPSKWRDVSHICLPIDLLSSGRQKKRSQTSQVSSQVNLMAKVQKVSYSAMKSAWLSIVIVRLEGGAKPKIYQSHRSCFISKRFRYEEREGKRDHHPGLKNASHLWSRSIEKQGAKNYKQNRARIR